MSMVTTVILSNTCSFEKIRDVFNSLNIEHSPNTVGGKTYYGMGCEIRTDTTPPNNIASISISTTTSLGDMEFKHVSLIRALMNFLPVKGIKTEGLYHEAIPKDIVILNDNVKPSLTLQSDSMVNKYDDGIETIQNVPMFVTLHIPSADVPFECMQQYQDRYIPTLFEVTLPNFDCKYYLVGVDNEPLELIESDKGLFYTSLLNKRDYARSFYVTKDGNWWVFRDYITHGKSEDDEGETVDYITCAIKSDNVIEFDGI